MNKLKSLVNSVNQFVNRNFPRGSNGRFIFFSVLSIMLVSTLLWGSTYSLFVSSNIDNELNVYKTGNLDVTYTLSSDNVTFDSNKTYSDDEVTSIKPYRITVTNNGNVPYKFNVRLNDETASNSIDSKYIMTQVGKLSFNSLSECTDNIIKSGIVVLAGTSVDIDVRVWLAEDTPNSEIGKSFFGSLTIDGIAVYSDKKEIDNSNLIANYRVNASEYIMSLYNGDEATEVNIAGNSSKPKVYLDNKNEEDEDTWGIMLDNNGEYRYYGKNPNNYVEYNDELWRIISVSTVYSSEEDTEGEQRIRLIKDTKIGDYAWDNDDYTNNWSDATLMCQLNTMYYNDTVPACEGKSLDSLDTSLNEEARTLIDNALWYLGGFSNLDESLYADDYYNIERNNLGYGSNPTRWIGKVGMMYFSDYIYASNPSECDLPGKFFDSNISNCTGTNWILRNEGTQQFITPYLKYSSGNFYIGLNGAIYSINNEEFHSSGGVQPLVILKSDVVITGGSGTSGDAYKIGLKGINDNVQTEVEAFGFAKDIIDLYNEGEESDYIKNVSYGTNGKTVDLNTKQRIMMVEQGTINGVDYGVEYRYYGADLVEDPTNNKYLTKNYVDFNGELWRIISVSKVFSNTEDTTGETRVRIIKETPIDSYAWDDDSNNWSDATLMCQLNTMYYNDTVPACEGKSLDSLTTSLNTEAKSLIDNALWYLGGTSDYNLYADDWYNVERNNSGYGSNPTRWTGKVGIMYPSDYLYAADLSVCKMPGGDNTDWVGYSDQNCAGTDWLLDGEMEEWLISPDPDGSIWLINYVGYISSGSLSYDSWNVSPLAVLKSDVIKLEGEGTSGNPYKLGLGT